MQNVELSYDQFVEMFKPVKNHIDSNASFDGLLYETHGAELEYVRSCPTETVWTVLDCDECQVITSGYHHVNRLGYIVCDVAVADGLHFDVPLDD